MYSKIINVDRCVNQNIVVGIILINYLLSLMSFAMVTIYSKAIVKLYKNNKYKKRFVYFYHLSCIVTAS